MGLFLRVDDFHGSYERTREAGVEFITEPHEEPYGERAVFLDVAGNPWTCWANRRPENRAPGSRSGRAHAPVGSRLWSDQTETTSTRLSAPAKSVALRV